MAPLRLTKHHALGNDFLVLLDLEGRHPVDAPLARWLCDRRRGIGADGLLRAGPGADGADVTMQVRNADGGEAETSGNGLRCLAQALWEAGVAGPRLTVGTAAGVRRLTVSPGPGPGRVMVEVDMGPVTLGPDQPVDPPAQRARTADVGNPHLVVLGPDPRELDLTALAPRLAERLAPGQDGGVNVELVAAGPQRDEVTLRVWERGVGETPACGSGACAAASAARSWGLVRSPVRVHQPGGAVEVDLDGPGAILTGPAERIARIEVEL